MDKKALFYAGMPHDSDGDDDDLDNFPDFRNRNSQTGIHSQNLVPANEIEQQQVSSQSLRIIPSQASAETQPWDHLKENYISTPDELNKRLKLDKKDLIRIKSRKLAGCVLLYWPVKALEAQKGQRGRKVRKDRNGAWMGAVEHGAELALQWDDGHRITHIVADRHFDIAYQAVHQALKLESLPENVQLVKSTWVDAMIISMYHEKESRHRLPGHIKSSTLTSNTNEPRAMKRQASEMQANSPHTGHISHREGNLPALKKSKTEQTEPRSHESLANESPELMRQQRKGKSSLAALAIVNLEQSGRQYKCNGDELDKAVAEERKRVTNSRVPSQRSDQSYATTPRSEMTDKSSKSVDDESGKENESDHGIDRDELTEHQSIGSGRPANAKAKNFLCANKNIEGRKETGPNAELIEQLQILASHYANKSEDTFRAKGYREAISVLRKQRHSITTREQALSLKRIGSSIATKIEQFGQHGKIDLIETFATDPKEQAIQLFTRVYGVGQRTADMWYHQGLRTLEDLNKVDLSEYQRIGLEHYDDFNSRIPRAEVTAHVDYVTKAARKISEHLEVVVGGSYRRGQADSGDIDFLITAPDSIVSTVQLQKLVFEQLIPSLRSTGYIKADLTIPSETKDASKWLGAACLLDAKPQIWRRVDILLVPNAEWGAALIYFTGNDIFNRSIRLLARRQGGSLNQRGFFKGVVRDARGYKVIPGMLVESRDERKIFEALGVKWRPPHERCP